MRMLYLHFTDNTNKMFTTHAAKTYVKIIIKIIKIDKLKRKHPTVIRRT